MAPLLLSIGGILAASAFHVYREQVTSGVSYATYTLTALAVLALGTGLAVAARTLVLLGRVHQERLAALRADTLPERAKHAVEILQEATTLVQELQTELAARTALLEEVRRQVAESGQEAEHLKKLDEGALKLVDEALKRRLDEVERGARQRDWFIGTVVAIAVGIIAIMISHFGLGF